MNESNQLDHGDIVKVLPNAPEECRPGARAWVVDVFAGEDCYRWRRYFDQFPQGVVCTMEFEDGSSLEIHEDCLAKEA